MLQLSEWQVYVDWLITSKRFPYHLSQVPFEITYDRETPMTSPRTVLCLASYQKGHRFLTRCKKEGCHVTLLTIESLLNEPWPREFIDEVFALPTFSDERALLNAVSYVARTRSIDRVVALDDFDVEVAAAIREHLRLPGLGASAARLFRDKLAMRVKAAELGVRIPQFTGIFNHDRVRQFLGAVSPPWLLKPRSQASAAGIRKLHDAADVWKELERLGDEQSFYLLESFVAGDLYHVDSLVADGRVVFAEVNAYARPLLDVYHGGGVYVTRTVPRDRPEVATLRTANEQVLTGFGLSRGASHTEFLRAHADGSIYLVETSARVGGSNTAEMVEAATGVNLWEEWAALEARPDNPPNLPPQRERHAGVVVSLARQEWPDDSPFNDPEIFFRLKLKQHIGLVVCAERHERVEYLLSDFSQRIARDYLAVLPAADRVSH